MPRAPSTHPLAAGLRAESVGRRSLLVHGDGFAWLRALPENTLHAIVTDPPYGVHEYELAHLEKRANGSGGLWRIPPSFDGSTRQPLPRFTALNPREREAVASFFTTWAACAVHALRPGGHVLIAMNNFLAQLVLGALVEGGLEYRAQLVRLVRTLRGGDRPKNAEKEFPDVSASPRSCWEPWGLLRKPLPPGMTVAECLRTYQTGGLRRLSAESPFQDLIPSERTPQAERAIADHPSLKPQSLLRHLVRAALPLGVGVVADPFCGSGSTLAAAEAIGVEAVGVERNPDYFKLAKKAIPRLTAIETGGPEAQVALDLA